MVTYVKGSFKGRIWMVRGYADHLNAPIFSGHIAFKGRTRRACSRSIYPVGLRLTAPDRTYTRWLVVTGMWGFGENGKMSSNSGRAPGYAQCFGVAHTDTRVSELFPA